MLRAAVHSFRITQGDLLVGAQRIVRDEAPVIFMWGFRRIWGVSNKVDWKAPQADEIDMYSPPTLKA
ncbi:MAG: hypothetical protein M9890_11645 [Thermomicrobiales bacterium]|nr:hypothetical protein [Thermomicrobiales bacterium]